MTGERGRERERERERDFELVNPLHKNAASWCLVLNPSPCVH